MWPVPPGMSRVSTPPLPHRRRCPFGTPSPLILHRCSATAAATPHRRPGVGVRALVSLGRMPCCICIVRGHNGGLLCTHGPRALLRQCSPRHRQPHCGAAPPYGGRACAQFLTLPLFRCPSTRRHASSLTRSYPSSARPTAIVATFLSSRPSLHFRYWVTMVRTTSRGASIVMQRRG